MAVQWTRHGHPCGLAGTDAECVDLDGEGLSGMLLPYGRTSD
jgi:hypothetical protein